MIRKLILCCFILLFISQISAETSDISAKELMKGFHLLGIVESLDMNFTMTIKSSRGVKERGLALLLDRTEEDEKLLVSIIAPQYLSNMKYLSVKKNNHETLWLKTSRGVRRLSTGNFGDSLFGSDFSVEDLSLIDIGRYEWSFEAADGNGLTRIKAVPLYDNSFYSYKIFSIDVEKQIVYDIRFFDKEDKLVKEYSLLEHMLIGDEEFPGKMLMKTIEEGSETLISVDKVKLNPRLSSGVFNKGNL